MKNDTLKKIFSWIVALFVASSCIGVFSDINIACAADATDKDYAHEFLGGGSSGSSSSPGWDNDVITQIDPNVGGDGLEGTSDKYINAGWNFLFTIDKFLVGVAVLFFVGRIAGRGIWEVAFGGSTGATLPKILQASNEKGATSNALPSGHNANRQMQGGSSSPVEKWLIPMCKDALKGFILSAGVIIIINIVAGLVMFGLGILPAPDFSSFHL